MDLTLTLISWLWGPIGLVVVWRNGLTKFPWPLRITHDFHRNFLLFFILIMLWPLIVLNRFLCWALKRRNCP